MTIKIGDKLPPVQFRMMTPDGIQPRTTDEIFKGKTVALFSVPGAYTGTCHKMHLPSITMNADAMKAKGVDTIAVTAVNDAFVMSAWKRDTDLKDQLIYLADGNADFAKAIGLSFDGSGFGLGVRGQRFSMLIKDGIVQQLNIEKNGGEVTVSGGDALLAQI